VIFENIKKKKYEVDSPMPIRAEIQDQVLTHIEGALVGPTLVRLGMNGCSINILWRYFAPKNFISPENFKIILDFFCPFRLVYQKNGNHQFGKWIVFCERAAAYGVTVSYLPTL
jgi:hypothetical protein